MEKVLGVIVGIMLIAGVLAIEFGFYAFLVFVLFYASDALIGTALCHFNYVLFGAVFVFIVKTIFRFIFVGVRKKDE